MDSYEEMARETNGFFVLPFDGEAYVSNTYEVLVYQQYVSSQLLLCHCLRGMCTGVVKDFTGLPAVMVFLHLARS